MQLLITFSLLACDYFSRFYWITVWIKFKVYVLFIFQPFRMSSGISLVDASRGRLTAASYFASFDVMQWINNSICAERIREGIAISDKKSI